MERSLVGTTRKVIDGLMNGKINHSTQFKDLEYKHITFSHVAGRGLGFAFLVCCQFLFIIGLIYCISKINMNLEKQKILMISIGIALVMVFGFLDAFSICFGEVKKYHISEEKEPSFVNGFADIIRQSLFLR